MKKQVIVILEVDTDETDNFIEDDLKTEINCCSCFYKVKDVLICNEKSD